MNNYGNVRKSMGPVRWWFWERGQRNLARQYGRDNAFWGHIGKDPTALSGKIDPELSEIFQEEYRRGYASGMSWRALLTFVFFSLICFVVVMSCAKLAIG